MNKILLIIFILVFFLRIETNLLSESIFNVNNININEKKYENKEQYLNQVFYKGFSILINRILLEKNQDLKDTTSINQIKKLVSHYKISEDKNNTKKNVSVDLFFDKEKINNFFQKKGISYTDLSLTDVTIFPINIKGKDIFIFSNNYFYDNWNKTKKKNNIIKKQINYVMQFENLESIEFIKRFEENFEDINVKNLFLENQTNYNFLIIIIDRNDSSKIFLKGTVNDKIIIKNMNLKKNNTNTDFNEYVMEEIKKNILEIIKSNNMIDISIPSFLNISIKLGKNSNLIKFKETLGKVELVQNYKFEEITRNQIKMKIKFFGKIEKILNKLENQGFKINLINDQWVLKL